MFIFTLFSALKSSRLNFQPVKYTVFEAYEFAEKYLTGQGERFESSVVISTEHYLVGVSEGEYSARYLISKAASLGYQYSDFQKNRDTKITESVLSSFISDCERRCKGEPIQYILGDWDFYGLTVKCKSPVLIPRPETEELVDYILKSNILQNIENLGDSPQICDIGAGTGVIGLSLLSKLSSASQCVALDINPIAVALAMENAQLTLTQSLDVLDQNHTRYVCLQQSFQEYVANANSYSSGQQRFDIIVSNPPYIPSSEIPNLQREVRDFEDHGALDGGSDGLNLIREIIRLSPRLLRPDGPGEVWMEVSREHPDMIKEWIKIESDKGVDYGMDYVQGINDLSGQPRFVRLRKTFKTSEI